MNMKKDWAVGDREDIELVACQMSGRYVKNWSYSGTLQVTLTDNFMEAADFTGKEDVFQAMLVI